MKISKYLLVCLISLASASASNAAVVTFDPFLDADVQPNTSVTTPYASNTNQTNAPAGIPDNVQAIFSDTYFYTDSSTGIDFSFDVQWEATGGNLNGTNTILGVGGGADVGVDEGVDEQLTVSFSNLQVDFTDYISGSLASITNPQLDSATLSLLSIGFADRTSSAADESIVDIEAGGSVVNFGTGAVGINQNTFTFGVDGLTTNETSFTVSHNTTSTVDNDFALAFTRPSIVLNVSQATAVPEPSALLPLLMLATTVLRRHRRK